MLAAGASLLRGISAFVTWGTQRPMIATAGSGYGSFVAFTQDGTNLAVGASGRAGYTGAAYMYVCTATACSLGDSNYGAAAGDYFGVSVAVSTRSASVVLLAVGAHGVSTFRGAVSVFACVPTTGVCGTPMVLADPGATAFDHFGYAVAMGASVLAVGADGDSAYAGAVYTYTCSTASPPVCTYRGVLSPTSAGRTFGWSVSLSAAGTLLAVGASCSGTTTCKGAVYTYPCTGGVCSTIGQAAVIASDGVAGDLFGDSVSLAGDGSLLAVGAWAKGTDQGAVYIYVCTPGVNCTDATEKLINGPGANWRYGYAVALSYDGSLLAVGAVQLSTKGNVFTYECSDAGVCTGAQQITPTYSQAAIGDRFGYGLSIPMDGSPLAVGVETGDTVCLVLAVASNSGTPTPSITSSQDQTPTQTSSASTTQTRTQTLTSSIAATPSQSETISQRVTSTPSSMHSPYPLSLFISIGNTLSPLSSVVISDGQPVSELRLWLNRCPSASDTTALTSSKLTCTATAQSVYIAFGLPRSDASSLGIATAPAAAFALAEGACVSAASRGSMYSYGPALLAQVLYLGAFYRVPQASSVVLTCSIESAASGVVASTSLPLALQQTLWPLWDDAILVSASGAMRSAVLGVALNATAALLLTAAEAASVNVMPQAASLASALASPTAVLAAARVVWGDNRSGPGALNYSLLLGEATASFSLTLSGASRVVLYAGVSSMLAATNAFLGSAACNISAASDDDTWAVLDTPSAAVLCGSEAGDCGYAALLLNTAPVGGALGATLECPPFCPGAVGGGIVPVALAGGGFALGTDPPTSLGSLPSLLPATDSGASSVGIYYAAACAQTGLWTDPATGACANASDPASSRCAYGSGARCSDCPGGALCPGGSRLWPRVGFWAPTEAASSVSPCGPPDPEVKCGGWNVSCGAVQCGAAYRAGSPLCGACAPSYYLQDDGSCAACPVIAGAWGRYRVVLLLLCGAFASALCVGLLLAVIVKLHGGTLDGSARLMLDLALWSVAALQVCGLARGGETVVQDTSLSGAADGVAGRPRLCRCAPAPTCNALPRRRGAAA